MKKNIRKYYLLIFGLLLSSCFQEKTSKIQIPAKYYNIEVKYKSHPLIKSIDMDLTQDYHATIGSKNSGWFFNTDYVKHKTRFTDYRHDHFFKGNYTEVEFDRLILSRPIYRWAKCLIGISETNKAFYIYWTNVPYDTTKDGLYLYNWDVGKETDTLYSNLDLEIIKKVYKDFRGVFIKRNVKKITLDLKYSTTERRFYDEIKFEDFDLGYPFTRYPDDD